VKNSFLTNRMKVALETSIVIFFLLGCSSPKVKPLEESAAAPIAIPTPSLEQVTETESQPVGRRFQSYHNLFADFLKSSGFSKNPIQSGLNCKGRTKSQIPFGSWTCYSNSRQKVSRAWLKKGRVDGWVRTFYPNQRLESEAFWRNGKLHGPAVKYYETGARQTSAMFKKDKLHGLVVERDDWGQKTWSSSFSNSLQNGEEKIFYTNGSLKSRTSFRDGLKSGKHTEWFESGNLKLFGRYLEDKPIGRWTSWSEDGRSQSGPFDQVGNP
jgi:antitoxin component YwqK of YwqJK toxin-antitoxin module